MTVSWGAIIGEGTQPRIAREVGGLEGNGAAGRIANQVRPQRGDRANTIVTHATRANHIIACENRIQQDEPARETTTSQTCLVIGNRAVDKDPRAGDTATVVKGGLVSGDSTVQDRQGTAADAAAAPRPGGTTGLVSDDGTVQNRQGTVAANATAICVYEVIGNGALDDGHRATEPTREGKAGATEVAQPAAVIRAVVGERAVDETKYTAILVEKTPAWELGGVVVDDTIDDEDPAAAGKEAPPRRRQCGCW